MPRPTRPPYKTKDTLLSDPVPRLFLVRHGETEWTETRRHTGRTDIALSPRGETQAAKLATRLAGHTFSHVFTSPLRRARRTCELAGFGDRCVVDGDLVEWDYGHYEGLTTQQIQQQNPDWHLFRDGDPGGESPTDVAGRADRFLARFAGLEGDVLAFSSGHLIRMLAGRWLGLDPRHAGGFYTATASLGVLGYEHGRDDRVVLLWNETVRD